MPENSTRILHTPRRFAIDEWGGTESVVLNLCREQRRLGFDPEIHTSRALAPLPRETWREIPIRRYRYTYPFLGLSRSEKHALDKKGGNLLSLDLFFNLLKARNVRIFHAHVLKRMGGAVLTAARLRRKPFVATLHGNFFDVPPAEAASIVEAQEGHFEWGKPFGAIFRSRHLLTEADAVLCVGHSEYEKAKAALPHDRVYYLSNGVTPGAFENGNRNAGRLILGWPSDAIAFGCLSRIDPQKNQLLLVNSFADLVTKRPDLPLRLLLGGPLTDESYRREIEKCIAMRGVEKLVSLRGPVESESRQHRDLLAALDAFVLPSRHEPFGIVILEAWAAGLPVITTAVGGLKRLVEDGTDGLQVQPGDQPALADALLQLATDSNLRAQLAANGRRKTHAEYTWEAVSDRLENIYQAAEDHRRGLPA